MPALERYAETLRFNVLSAEHSISPTGALRQWLKLVLRISLIVLAPAVLLTPLISFILTGVAEWLVIVRAICVNLAVSVLLLIGVVLIVRLFLLLMSHWHG